MHNMISIINKDFPTIVGDLDNNSHSPTRHQMIQSSLGQAQNAGAHHSQGPIRVVAAWDMDPECIVPGQKNPPWRTYVGLDKNDTVWLFDIWCGPAKYKDQENKTGLYYEPHYAWGPIEGPMDDEFWDDIDNFVGALLG